MCRGLTSGRTYDSRVELQYEVEEVVAIITSGCSDSSRNLKNTHRTCIATRLIAELLDVLTPLKSGERGVCGEEFEGLHCEKL